MSRGRIRFEMQRFGKRRMRVCIAEVLRADGTVIWSDNSGVQAWPGLLEDARHVAGAATLMENKGQKMRSWSRIVDEAAEL